MFDALLLLASAAAGQAGDPLAEARAGKIQCVTPNREKKTCAGIASYTVRKDGSFDSVMTMMIVPAPLVTMKVTNSGTTEGDAVCNVVDSADFDKAVMSMDGGPVNAAMEQAIRSQIGASITPMQGKKACARDKADGDVIVAVATLDGVARPDLDQRYIWVSPSEGYTIGQ